MQLGMNVVSIYNYSLQLLGGCIVIHHTLYSYAVLDKLAALRNVKEIYTYSTNETKLQNYYKYHLYIRT